jgi:flavin reductase (DIM6/NTAB) family NADH-FMN oxidoreductase RutF
MSVELLTDRFRDAMRRTASGVTVVTTDGARGRAGVTVSTFCSLSMEPPSVIASVHRDSRALPVILGNGVFAANTLAQDQRRIAEAFAGLIPELRENRFAAGRWFAMTTRAPALHDALACFDCRVARTFTFGSHCIVVGEVVDVTVGRNMPLVYADRSFCRVIAA